MGIKKAQPDWKCIGYSEIDKYAIQTYKKHFPNHKNYGDATKIDPDRLPDFDMLCGGFPCQAFSIAGKRRGFEDTRGTLFFDIGRILNVKRPKIVFLENVKGLLNHNKGETFRIILQTLDELGYEIQWMVLNSKFFGVPQNRERVFIIGSLRGTSRPEILPFKRTNTETNQEGIGTEEITRCLDANMHKGVDAKGYFEKKRRNLIVSPTITEAIGRQGCSKEDMLSLKRVAQAQRIRSVDGVSQTLQGQAGGQGAKTGLYAIFDDYNSKMRSDNVAGTLTSNTGSKSERNGQKLVFSVLTPDREEKRQNGRRFKEDGEPSFTLTGQDIHGVMITQVHNMQPMKIRRLTPIECERLQGFPDDWTEQGINEKGEKVKLSDTQRYKQCGNAVTVNVIECIIKHFLFSRELMVVMTLD